MYWHKTGVHTRTRSHIRTHARTRVGAYLHTRQVSPSNGCLSFILCCESSSLKHNVRHPLCSDHLPLRTDVVRATTKFLRVVFGLTPSPESGKYYIYTHTCTRITRINKWHETPVETVCQIVLYSYLTYIPPLYL